MNDFLRLPQIMKEAEVAMKRETADVKRKKNETKRLKEERKKENALKGASVQIVKNTTKVRKWTHKARQKLIKMNPEQVEKLCRIN